MAHLDLDRVVERDALRVAASASPAAVSTSFTHLQAASTGQLLGLSANDVAAVAANGVAAVRPLSAQQSMLFRSARMDRARQ